MMNHVNIRMCLPENGGVAGSSLRDGTVFMSLSKTGYSMLSTGSIQGDSLKHNLNIIDWGVK